MRPTPHYITEARIATEVVHFAWDEWNCRQYYMVEDGAMFERLDRLTNKANTGLTIAIGEWISERFSTVDTDPAPRKYLEAAWAGVVHRAYCKYTETIDDNWRGPVRAPLALTITTVNDALYELGSDMHVARRVCWNYNLARHVLPHTQAFETWFAACVQRMERFHCWEVDTQDEEEEDLFADYPWQGSPVPREAFDTAFNYSPAMAPALLDAFLRTLKPESNNFLRSPGELSDIEEIPEPYRYGNR